MLEVTNAALDHLRNALTQSATLAGTGDCFRLIVDQENKIGLAVQAPQTGDHTFELEGATVLAMPLSLSEALSERVLDVGDEGRLMFLPKPN